MNKFLVKIFPYINIVVMIILAVILIFVSCNSMPKKMDGELPACYDSRYCIWAFKKTKDKSFCVDSKQSCANYRRHEYCKKEANRAEKQNYSGCWDKLK